MQAGDLYSGCAAMVEDLAEVPAKALVIDACEWYRLRPENCDKAFYDGINEHRPIERRREVLKMVATNVGYFVQCTGAL